MFCHKRICQGRHHHALLRNGQLRHCLFRIFVLLLHPSLSQPIRLICIDCVLFILQLFFSADLELVRDTTLGAVYTGRVLQIPDSYIDKMFSDFQEKDQHGYLIGSLFCPSSYICSSKGARPGVVANCVFESFLVRDPLYRDHCNEQDCLTQWAFAIRVLSNIAPGDELLANYPIV